MEVVIDSIYTNPLLDTIREVGRDVRAPRHYFHPEICIENINKGMMQSAHQQSEGTHNSGFGGDLSPPSSGDGSTDGGNGGTNIIDTSQSSRLSSRDVHPIMSDHNNKRSEEYEEETIAHTYRHRRKTKHKATKAPPNYDNQVINKYADEQQMPSTFTRSGYCNWSCGSDSYNGGSYNYGYN
ncbi:hypothetical protein Cgig2_009630 [Carnegiea gigantea]|uniref:Uncharacterized protein n=1 Tax=Carnegiea gigantea TaxID=171969 RepID=A0A9Q1Q6W0_9CARY|nr:hypothetical protein Cgig2_009630 [Carnegiea gigantea]